MTSREMWLFRWTKDGVERRSARGMTQLKQDVEQRISSNGGTLVDFQLFSGFADWDGMYIIEWATAQAAAQFLRGHLTARSDGVVAAAQVVRLVSPEEFDLTSPAPKGASSESQT